MKDVAFQSAAQLAWAIRNKDISSRELLDHYLARIDQHNPTLNAVVTLDIESARQRADAADAALAKGQLSGPLHGLPMTVKDTLETAGVRTTAGFPPLAEHVPSSNATAVERAEFFQDYDVLLCPISPMAAFPHDQREPVLERTPIDFARHLADVVGGFEAPTDYVG